MSKKFANIQAFVDDLQNRRYNVVLAHPERYTFIQKDPEFAYFLAQQGCVLQVNKGSVFGQFGSRCRNLARQFMDDGIVSILASDAHDFQYRTPSMERLMGYLERRYPWKQVQVWTSENPSRILKGNPLVDFQAI